MFHQAHVLVQKAHRTYEMVQKFDLTFVMVQKLQQDCVMVQCFHQASVTVQRFHFAIMMVKKLKGTVRPKNDQVFKQFFLLLIKYQHVADVVVKFYSCVTCVNGV